MHRVYVEQCGNPNGFPVVFLHGGPCSGCRPEHRRFFDPGRYHIILLDQRGCGRSMPYGELEYNNSGALIDDLERIRRYLGIGRWLLFGGSWGAALALLYAQQHQQRVAGMIVRGVFLARQKDLDWFVKEGVGRIYPEYRERLIDSIREGSKGDLLSGLVETVFSDDREARKDVTRAWMAWGGQTALGGDYQPGKEPEQISEKMVRQVQMEMHYAKHHYFISENQILDNCRKLQSIPTLIIHGRLDLVCPVEAAYSLNKALPDSELIIVPNAGHVPNSEEMIDALVTATDNMLHCIK